MKRLLILVVVVALMSGAAFAAKGSIVGMGSSGTHEYLNMCPPGPIPIGLPAIGWKIGAIPSTEYFVEFLFGNSGCLTIDTKTGGGNPGYAGVTDQWYLVTKTGGTYKADPAVAGTAVWDFRNTVSDNTVLRFSVVNFMAPNNGTWLANGIEWYLYKSNSKPPLNGVLITDAEIAVPVKICNCPPTGTQFPLTVNVWANFLTNSPTLVDTNNLANVFTVCDEWCYDTTGTLDRLNIFDGLTDFGLDEKIVSTNHIKIGPGKCGVTPFYSIKNKGALTANDFFDFMISGNNSGVQSISLWGITSTAPFFSPTVVDLRIPGDVWNGHLADTGVSDFVIKVKGNVPLTPQYITFQINWNPGPQDCYCSSTVPCCSTLTETEPGKTSPYYGLFNPNDTERELGPNCRGWIWGFQGTIFRSSWLAAARESNYLSVVRFSSQDDFQVNVYCDIFMDDGYTKLGYLVGTIPAHTSYSWDLQNVLVASGRTGLVTNPPYLTNANTGRITFYVDAENTQCFGVMWYRSPIGYSMSPLEKLTVTIGAYHWEK